MIALAAAAGVSLALVLSLVRLFVGPTLYDRALAAHPVAVQITVICAAGAAVAVRAAWLDVALAFVFALLITSTEVLKYFRARSFQAPLARRGEDF